MGTMELWTFTVAERLLEEPLPSVATWLVWSAKVRRDRLRSTAVQANAANADLTPSGFAM